MYFFFYLAVGNIENYAPFMGLELDIECDISKQLDYTNCQIYISATSNLNIIASVTYIVSNELKFLCGQIYQGYSYFNIEFTFNKNNSIISKNITQIASKWTAKVNAEIIQLYPFISSISTLDQDINVTLKNYYFNNDTK
jgi:hypothetical protein